MAIYRSELSAIVCGVNAGVTPIVAECGVDVVMDAKFPNIKINYDRSKNQFFGRA